MPALLMRTSMAAVAVQDLGRPFADRRQAGEVEQHELDVLSPTGGLDVGDGGVALGRVSGGDHHPCPGPGQGHSGLLADARISHR